MNNLGNGNSNTGFSGKVLSHRPKTASSACTYIPGLKGDRKRNVPAWPDCVPEKYLHECSSSNQFIFSDFIKRTGFGTLFREEQVVRGS